MKRPKDMTIDELRSLPERRYEIMERRLTIKPVMCSFLGEDDLVSASIDGRTYRFGQFTDGSWFKEIL